MGLAPYKPTDSCLISNFNSGISPSRKQSYASMQCRCDIALLAGGAQHGDLVALDDGAIEESTVTAEEPTRSV